MSATSTNMLNQALFEQLNTPGLQKQAADAVNDYTRTKMREDGFLRKIMPPIPITNDELDRRIDTDEPWKIIDKEPNNPAAISVPFVTLPIDTYIRGPRYAVAFSRILSPRFAKDVDQLRTWHMDIRQVLSDNSIKDMLAEEDSKFIAAVNAAMLGANTPVPYNGNVVQWETISGGITRETWPEALKIMPRGPSSLEAHTVLINSVTIKEVMKWGRDEIGGDWAMDIAKQGWAATEFMGNQLIITIKRGIVPDNTIFMFADPKFIGKHFMLEDTVMYIKKEHFMIEFFAYQTSGASIGHTGGLARADFE